MPRDTGDYPIATTGTLQVVHRKSAVKLQAAVRGGHPRASTLHLDRPEKCIDTAFDYLLYGARPAVARITREPNPEAVAVHDTAHFRRRNEDAVFQALDPEKAIAGAIRADGPFDRASRLGGNTVSGLISLAARGAR
jgi:hypothetical protein